MVVTTDPTVVSATIPTLPTAVAAAAEVQLAVHDRSLIVPQALWHAGGAHRSLRYRVVPLACARVGDALRSLFGGRRAGDPHPQAKTAGAGLGRCCMTACGRRCAVTQSTAPGGHRSSGGGPRTACCALRAGGSDVFQRATGAACTAGVAQGRLCRVRVGSCKACRRTAVDPSTLRATGPPTLRTRVLARGSTLYCSIPSDAPLGAGHAGPRADTPIATGSRGRGRVGREGCVWYILRFRHTCIEASNAT